jgi:cobalt-zinc-cadmium efflux system outer membrane protein
MPLTSITTKHARIVVAALLALSISRASAGDISTNVPALSLADAQRLALQSNWDLLAAKSGVDSANAQLMAAKEFPNPTMSISTAKIAGHDEATSLGNAYWNRGYDSIVSVNQLLEIAGKRRDRQTASREGARGAKARFHDARRILEQAVTKAYLGFLLAEENARTLTQSSEYIRREADIARARNKAGDLSDSDTKQILINAEQYQLQADSAKANAAQARAQLETLLGNSRPPEGWTPSDTLETLAEAGAAEAVAPSGSGERADVLAAAADLRSAEANLKLQKAMRVPDPTALLEYERNPMPPGPPPPDTFGVGVSFPLPIWNRNTGNIKAAEAARDQSAIALGKARAQAALDLTNARIAYREASQRRQRYQTQIAPQATQVRESVSFAYEKGGATLVDLLDAERTDNDVRLAAAQALSDTASAAADLRAAKAVISEADLNRRSMP